MANSLEPGGRDVGPLPDLGIDPSLLALIPVRTSLDLVPTRLGLPLAAGASGSKLVRAGITGRIITQWSYAEASLSHLVAFLTGAQPHLLHMVTQDVSASSLVGWARSLVRALVPSNSPDHARLLALLGECDSVRADRNNLVHGMWKPGTEPGTAVVRTIKTDRSDIILDALWTSHDLTDLLNRVNAQIRQGANVTPAGLQRIRHRFAS